MTSDMDGRFDWLVSKAAAQSGPALRVAVIHPVDASSLKGALDAARAGIMTPILVGPIERMEAAADLAGLDLSGIEKVEVPYSHAAASRCVELIHEGKADALMKGSLHTNEMMAEVVKREGGLRTDRRMSHVFLLSTAGYHKPLLISDGALNIAPDLTAKRWITQNAIDAARALGIDPPKVAILSATEEVDPIIPSTLDAAALCKMADRGQIKGGILDGPLAFDLAVSPESVATKGLKSAVAGDADVLIVPSIESGNMLAKQLDYLAGASAAGIVLGATVPIILTSRADSAEERLASCAFASAVAHWQREKS
jgi:phosphate acetyltransferase